MSEFMIGFWGFCDSQFLGETTAFILFALFIVAILVCFVGIIVTKVKL